MSVTLCTLFFLTKLLSTFDFMVYIGPTDYNLNGPLFSALTVYLKLCQVIVMFLKGLPCSLRLHLRYKNREKLQYQQKA